MWVWLVVFVFILLITLALLWYPKSVSGGVEMPKYDIRKRLGSGAFSDAHLINHPEYGECVLKRGKVLQKNVDKKTLMVKTGEHKAETDFYKFVDTLPEADQKYFVKCYEVNVYKCKHPRKAPSFVMNMAKHDKKFLKELNAHERSPYCIDYILEFAGKATKSDFTRMVKTKETDYKYGRKFAHDMLKAISILQKAGYAHRDIHSGNVTVKDGQFKLIDYGELQKPKPFKITKESTRNMTDSKIEYMRYHFNNDLLMILYCLMNTGYWWEFYVKDVKIPPFDDYLRHMYKVGIWDDLLARIKGIFSDQFVADTLAEVTEWMAGTKKMPKQLGLRFNTFNDIVGILVGVHYEDVEKEFWKPILGKYDIPLAVPREDLEFIIENYRDMDKIIDYFSSKSGGSLDWDKLKIGKYLGYGSGGDVYQAEVNGAKYALKRIKVPDAVVIDRPELQFWKYINNLPEDEQKYFIPLVEHRVYECDYKRAKTKYLDPESVKKENAYPYCLEYLMELAKPVAYSFKGENIQQMISDLLRAMKIVHKRFWMNDVNRGNIVLHKGTYRFIDYDNTRPRDRSEKVIYNHDLTSFMLMFLTKRYMSIDKGKTRPSTEDYVSFLKEEQIWDDIESRAVEIMKRITPEKNNEELSEILTQQLFMLAISIFITYHESAYNKFWGKYSKKSNLDQTISKSDAEFMLDNFHDMDRIIDYFASKSGAGDTISVDELLETDAEFVHLVGRGGSGKSYLADKLGEQGFHVVHVDEVVREMADDWIPVYSRGFQKQYKKEIAELMQQLKKILDTHPKVAMDSQFLPEHVEELQKHAKQKSLFGFVEHRTFQSYLRAWQNRVQKYLDTGELTFSFLDDLTPEQKTDLEENGVDGPLFGEYLTDYVKRQQKRSDEVKQDYIKAGVQPVTVKNEILF